MKTSLWSRSSIGRISLALSVLMLAASAAVAQKAELVKVVDKDGRETSLYQKLITIKQPTIVRQSVADDSDVSIVSPYNVFYHAKTPSGQTEQGGYYRVADRAGTPRGWVAKDEVQIWATRFVIEPNRFDEENTFIVEEVGGTTNKAVFDPDKIPGDASQYCFILGKSQGKGVDAEDNGPFPVALCLARPDLSGVASSLNQISKMKLEIVFVLEMTDFFLSEYDGKKLVDYVRDLGAEYVEMIKNNKGSDGELPTRLGLVVYQDTNTEAPLKRPQIAQPLTDDLDRWLSALNSVQPFEIKGDFPEDGLSGLAAAVEKVKWSENSTKHIVQIGYGAWQEHGQRQGRKPSGIDHFLEYLVDPQDPIWKDVWDDHFGYNSSGRSLRDILETAFPTGGTLGNRMRLTKHIHMLRAGQRVEDQYEGLVEGQTGAEVVEMLKKLNRKLTALGTKDEVYKKYAMLPEKQKSFARMAFKAEFLGVFDQMAVRQYQDATQGPEGNGYFAEVQPIASDIKRVTAELKARIDAAIQLVAKVAQGQLSEISENREQGNEFTEPIWRMIGSAISLEKLIDTPVQVGIASVRSEATGRLVGRKLIMVNREELQRLGGVFSELHEKFEKKKARAQRKDITGILDELKRSLAQAATGQDIDESTELATLITDLPLRTEALKLTATDIAFMPSRDFEIWLEDLITAERRTQSLLTGDTKRWIKISSLDDSTDQYGFLKLSDMP